ncbi:methyltransferase, FxLD system [Streptomyces sulphureus]|uniref:methyltransferase, FxLD system n=1 Tax=Streptomyces sulphureus TaxID=47758 RepID=UPI000561F083|nr:methyltransferase, FxLD system [Streptomyces sulphureus]
MNAADRAARLRDEAVDTLVAGGTVTTKEVESALRKVPRHLFAREAPLEDVYDAYRAVVTKTDEYGVAQSSVSAPQVQAMMLEQAGIAPGARVLEIGSGGYNAALVAELVGEAGEVTTVDIDPDVTARARRLLDEAGYSRVRVVTSDAEEGVPQHARYDAIVVTAGAWDIPCAWVRDLAPHGRLVVPLRMRGLTRSISFNRHGDHLASTSALVCGFVPMRGAGAHRETLLLVNGTDEIGLRFDDGMPIQPQELDNAVRTPRAEVWSGVTLGRQEPFDTLQLYLATVLGGFCIMAVDPTLDSGVVAPTNKRYSLAAVAGDTFAYVTTRRTDDESSVEFGVHALGPHRQQLAEEIAAHLRRWNETVRGGSGPTIGVYPAGTPTDQLPGERVIDKRHSRITLSWPSPGETS